MMLDELILQIDMLLKELSFVRQSLQEGIQQILPGLQSGRSPQGLKISERVEEFEELKNIFGEILEELIPLSQELQKQLEEDGEVQQLQRDLARDQNFFQNLTPLLEKLAFISYQEKVTPLTVTPIVDLWEEVLRGKD